MICDILQSLMITRQKDSNRVRFHPCLLNLALIKFTLCCRHHVFSIWKLKAHMTVSTTLILWRSKKPRWSEHIFIGSLIILLFPYKIKWKAQQLYKRKTNISFFDNMSNQDVEKKYFCFVFPIFEFTVRFSKQIVSPWDLFQNRGSAPTNPHTNATHVTEAI